MSTLIRQGVLLLAHRKLRGLLNGLRNKRLMERAIKDHLGNEIAVIKKPIETQIEALVRQAVTMIEGGEPIRIVERGRLGHRVSKHAVFGTRFLDLPRVAQVFGARTAWVTDALRRGSTDPAQSIVVAKAMQLALDIGVRAKGSTDGTDLARVQAACMGMIAGIASDVIVNPVLRGSYAAITKNEWDRYKPEAVIAQANRRINEELLLSLSGSAWGSWWPEPSEIPNALYDAFILQMSSLPDPPQGQERLTVDHLRDAFRVERTGGMIGRDWGHAKWFGLLTPIFVMPVVALALAFAMFEDVRLFVDPKNDDEPPDTRELFEKSFSDLLALGLFTGAITPFAYSLCLRSMLPGTPEPFITNAILNGWRLLWFAVYLGVTYSDEDKDNTAARWIILGLLASPDLYALFRGICFRDTGRQYVYWLNTMPILSALFALAFAGMLYGMKLDADEGLELFGIIALMFVFGGFMTGMAALMALALKNGITAFEGFDQTRFADTLPLPHEVRALAGLFDDSTLWRTNAEELRLDRFIYPPGQHPILKMWWTGGNELKARHDHDRLVFIRADNSEQVVLVDPSMGAAALAVAIGGAMPGIQTRVVNTILPLSFPAALAPQHEPQLIRDSEENAYVLRGGARADIAAGFGSRGPSLSPLEGYRIVPSESLGDADSTAMGIASDLAALLCIGAVPSLSKESVRSGDHRFTEAFEVFRLWNLDERRVNEWRMLVEGGADTDKLTPLDEGRRPGAPPNPNAGGEATANQMGWVNLFRAWSRVATDPLADAEATTPMFYTPPPAPSNQKLSEAIKFLLNIP